MLRYFKKVEKTPSDSGLPGLTVKERAMEEVRLAIREKGKV